MAEPLDSILKEGIVAAGSGDRAHARSLFIRVVDADERNLPAWYWLSRLAETPEEREICLENVLALDPAHLAVQAELEELRKQMAEAGNMPRTRQDGLAASATGTGEERLAWDTASEPLMCPYCSGTTFESDRRCPHCRHDLYGRKPKSDGHSAYSLGLVLLWVLSANYVWVGLIISYFITSLAASKGTVLGAGPTLETVKGLLGIVGGEYALPELSLLPVALVGGGLFLFSLVVALGLYRRLAFFYWLTVAVILIGFLTLVFVGVSTEKVPVLGLLAGGGCLLLTIGFAFMAYDEYAWERYRLDASVDSDVDGPSALFGRGRVYAQHRMWAKAAAHWSKAVVLSPRHTEYRLALATAYLNLVKPEQVLEHLAAVQKLEPDNARARELLEALAH